MIGMASLRGLLATTRPQAAAGYVPVGPEKSAAMYAAKKVDLLTLAELGDPELAAAARAAVSQGLDIAWIGMAPSNVRVTQDGFTAIVGLRIQGEDFQRSVLLRSDRRNLIVSATGVPDSVPPVERGRPK